MSVLHLQYQKCFSKQKNKLFQDVSLKSNLIPMRDEINHGHN